MNVMQDHRQRDHGRRWACRPAGRTNAEAGYVDSVGRAFELGTRLSISTPPGDVDRIATRARNAGITLTSDPHDTEWQSRAFEVSDPSGFLLTVYSETSA